MARTRVPIQGSHRATPSRRSARRIANPQDEIPEVYQDMLAEAARNPAPKVEPQSKIVKRRRLDDGSAQMTRSEPATTDLLVLPSDEEGAGDEGESVAISRNPQTVYDDFDVSEDDSGEDFEDVNLEADLEADHNQVGPNEPLQIDLSKKPSLDIPSAVRRRKPATIVEKKIRLDVHKWHVICLLAHVQRRNHWCEDEQVQTVLKPLVPRNIVKLLHLDASQPQYQRTHSFNTAIEEVSKIWRSEWKVTEQGMRRAYWKDDPDDLKNVDDFPDPVDQDDFRDAAKSRSGSRDLAAQLFCALLRAVAVDTRLVCSLQPLPFSGVAKSMSPDKPKPRYTLASAIGRQPQWHQNGESPSPSNPRLRLYDAEPEQSLRTVSARQISKRIRDSQYPIFWVEVFNEAIQKWIPVDPLVRNTINKSKTGFEPPANDSLNSLSYVIAFEDDGSARDVTRRYAQFYNGKTRRQRVESTKEGLQWWKKTMSFFEKPFLEDRDEIESAELLTREESEQMPRNVQDFKSHPSYALERHLRRNEVIHPKREIGKVSIGLSKGGKLESVFRRKDVLVVKTADQWYRAGRDVKIGEQPLKRVIPSKRRATPIGDEDEQAEGALLYAEFQTEPYVPPVVVKGKVPRNAYGNLDVYVTSMIPAGGIHVQHPDAAKAAKILGIDYADAVTGFEFKGRQGTAVTNGIVAAEGYQDAFIEVLEGIAYERARERSEKRSSIALQMWKRFLTALRIRERVNLKYGEGEKEAEGEDDDMEDESYQDGDGPDDEEHGGGFFPEQFQDSTAPTQSSDLEMLNTESLFTSDSPTEIEVPVVIHKSPYSLPEQQQQSSKISKIPPQDPFSASSFTLHHDTAHEEDEGGGFMIEDPPTVELEIQYPTPDPISTCHQATFQPSTPHILLNATTTSDGNELELPSPSTTKDSHLQIPRQEEKGEHKNENNPHSVVPSLHIDKNTANAQPHAISASPAAGNLPLSSSSSTLSQGSLLSHDPEDSDAEPDWLAEAVESD